MLDSFSVEPIFQTCNFFLNFISERLPDVLVIAMKCPFSLLNEGFKVWCDPGFISLVHFYHLEREVVIHLIGKLVIKGVTSRLNIVVFEDLQPLML